ncbi:uncharacterized protein LOC111614174 [Centruroides sculpturatus]|uniref:uncharacterized protein LOC111614174 n=1 Tax=Centruroides sculpturatus TaxID=218467 RepID=UPI000C6DD92C|nr:uncharacterized protein LOC111614174 [Centruroides sculpturatus]XP_023211325.1 uncharacterized protein LOC111614174 [Centruroides sculpturatus]XP_023211326.1 uncharacterized protein LOC111614174 [Centruroides sculpturatus]
MVVFKCCAPRCRGNYKNGPCVSMFKFPSNSDIRRKWIHALARDFNPTANTCVCELHFADEDIIKHSEYYDGKSGSLLKVPFKYPKLKDGAIPTLLPDYPSYLSSHITVREGSEEKRNCLEMENIQKAMR